MSTLMKFELGANLIEFEAGADYPGTRPVELYQIQDRTAAGTLQSEDLGVSVQTRILIFNLMSQTDYDAILDWFLNVVNGAELSFEFTDEKGVLGDVKITDRVFNLKEVEYELYSGSLTLEYV